MEHKEIKEHLADYFNGTVSAETDAIIREHLKECKECSYELSAVSAIGSIEVPDPGDTYWNTLSTRVLASLEHDRAGVLSGYRFYSKFIRPVPAAIMAAVIIIFTFSLIYLKGRIIFDPSFDDPMNFSYSAYEDLADLTDVEVSQVSIGIANNDAYVGPEMYGEYSYHYDLSSMSPEELEDLSIRLDELRTKGG